MYIGSILSNVEPQYIYDTEQNLIVERQIDYIAGLYKLFDEAIINARDHISRMIAYDSDTKKHVTYVNVTISEENGMITIENDGNGIDIIEHPEHKVYVPELIFGHLRTSTNYDKNEKRLTAGVNGLGIKLVFVLSTWAMIETVDHIRGLSYKQEFTNNLDIIGKPEITKLKKGATKPFTRVSFIPDYERLGLPDKLSPEMIALFHKRVYDIAGVTDHSVKKVKFSFNGSLLPITNFKQYVKMYIGDAKHHYEESGERWEYIVAMSPFGEGFAQVSFVNGICTYKGGSHVDYFITSLTGKLSKYIETKKKVKVGPSVLKEQISVFLRCDIENPEFGSQTKECMTSASKTFGSLPTITEEFVKKVAELGVMENACAISQIKEEKQAKKTDGTKTQRITGIEKFVDANLAGTKRSSECALILCEGLSAKSGVISGLEREDREFFGIYPMKGKLLNVRGESITKISGNAEISDLKKILGLETGKKYTDANISSLRYGRIIILCDADKDGSHIKGLIYNLFDSQWPSLCERVGFITYMNTPIVRAIPKRGSASGTLWFYHQGEYDEWCKTTDASQYEIKYFKGLGTSTADEFRKYMSDKKYVDFGHNGEPSRDIVDRTFNKKRAPERKDWLRAYDKNSYLNTNDTVVPVEEFINKELIHFSMSDCERSIPNIIDGLKPSQRKILHVVLSDNIVKEFKVAQLGARVSERTEYHHGEASLVGTIIGMAQNYVGSNNVALLEPHGQFGSRIENGKDHASERYIFTCMSPITRTLFHEEDDAVLTYLEEEGRHIEPEMFVPILPFVLFNNIRGIGTGFSTSIESYNPRDVVKYIRDKIADRPTSVTFIPYYEGFTGKVEQIQSNQQRFLIRGCYTIVSDDTVNITELPIGTSIEQYNVMLEKLLTEEDKKTKIKIKSFKNNSTTKLIDFSVVFPKGVVLSELQEITDINGVNGIESLLELTTTISNSNMYLLRGDLTPFLYNNVEEIIDAFYEVRLVFYEKRKAHLIAKYEALLVKLSNRAKYIKLCLSGDIDLRRKKEKDVEELLLKYNLVKIDNTFDYLIKMPMDSVTQENVEKILREEEKTLNELAELRGKSVTALWLEDLDIFELEYEKYLRELNGSVGVSVAKKTATKSSKASASSKKK